jgi:micrococcal nuclease
MSTRWGSRSGYSPVLVAIVVAWTSAAPAGEPSALTGQVTRVIDGDTLVLTAGDNRTLHVRLAQIDAPEKSQPYGERATEALSALTLGEFVRVEVVDLDRYGRTVGEVHSKGIHVNAEMVRQGNAWAYTRYATSLAVVDLEDEARREQRGLWKLPLAERDAPWVWRRQRRGAKDSAADAATADVVCGTKRKCKEMVSCAEARFYLGECRLTQLDGDGDGIPCESICRE